MTTLLFTIALVAVAFASHQLTKDKYKHVQFPFPAAHSGGWYDFIVANINSCKTVKEVDTCRELIILFDVKFSKQLPAKIFEDRVDKLWNRLETKHKILKSEDMKSDVRVFASASGTLSGW